MSKIYYWASNTEKNSGEGILALNFLLLLKKKYRKSKFVNLNKFKFRNTLFYNYIIPYLGAYMLWKYHKRGYIISYINYLPIWNFVLFMILPKKTILGPVTGTNQKKNFFYCIFKHLGIFFLKKRDKILMSHSQFKTYFKNKKDIYFNFLLYNFNFKLKLSKKIYDYIIYYKKNKNKGNDFLLKLVSLLSKDFKIVIIGDKVPHNLKNQNIFNYNDLKRAKALKIISQSKNAILSKENSMSYFALDCAKYKLNIFYNANDRLDTSIKTNIFMPIKYNNFNSSLKIIKKNSKSYKLKKIFKFQTDNFIGYLDN